MQRQTPTARTTTTALALLLVGLLTAPTAWAASTLAEDVGDATDLGGIEVHELDGPRWDAFKAKALELLICIREGWDSID